ncbi:hypothetical protein NVT86_09880 [Acinetobacter radioresistens]|nr:hypothetical protein [Acinetobacter radioresistens]
MLAEITRKFRCRNVFLSGSAHEFGDWDQKSTEEFLTKLGEILIQENFKITSGLGLGIGNAFVSGAIQEVYKKRYSKIDDYLTMKVFPQYIEDDNERARIWTLWREDLLSQAGIALFFMGNKLVKNKQTGEMNLELASGMDEEFQIAKKLGLKLIPIGCSGYKAKELYDHIINNFDEYYPNTSEQFKTLFLELDKKVDAPIKLLSVLQNILKNI